MYTLSTLHLAEPLSTFGLTLPSWGISLAFLPLCPLLLGAVVYLLLAEKGVPRIAVSFKIEKI